MSGNAPQLDHLGDFTATSREYSVDPLEVLFVHEVMSEGRSPLPAFASDSLLVRAGHPLIHTDDTLRHAANVMAQTGRNCLHVSDRSTPALPIGTVTLQQLLQGRLRDLHEERHSERALSPLSLIKRRGR